MTQRRKPTGETTFWRVQPGNVQATRVELPATKPEVEAWILECTLRSAKQARISVFGDLQPERNAEDNFDFTLRAPGGPQYLDLMEVFVLPDGTKGGHAKAAPVYDPRTMAAAVVSQIEEKSAHYGHPSHPLHLLLYSTDRRLHLHPPVAEHVAVAVGRSSHVFTTITYYAPLDSTHGFVFPMWPLGPEKLAEYEARSQAVSLVVLPGPSEYETTADGMSFTIDLTKLPKP